VLTLLPGHSLLCLPVPCFCRREKRKYKKKKHDIFASLR
jgi:hypothetical protein